jgi:biopolymer transport protein TolQ
MNATDVVTSGLSAPGAEISIWTMFWGAHFVVKIVMLGLLAASVWCWAIIVDKTLLFSRTRKAMDRFEEVFWSGQSLEELYRALSDRQTSNMSAVFVAAMREWKRSLEGSGRAFAGLAQRIDKVVDVTIQREVERLESKLLVLATIGSSAPFIGLFGTVWGIMRSFAGIAAANSTSLAVVAPGIAEALFATAMGLAAAIPAVVAYNKIAVELGRIAGRMQGLIGRSGGLLARTAEA